MDLQLNNKLALVTGSTAGIGFAIAKTLSAEGAHVILNGRTRERVDQAADAILAAHSTATLSRFVADVSDPDLAEQAARSFPHLDILINNAGVFEPRPFDDITDQEWRAMIDTNFMSGLRLSRHYLSKMKAAGWGRIIFISSESAVHIPAEMIHYGVTKTMQVALARGMAETTVRTAVTVNSILPGPTRSEGVEQFVQTLSSSRGVSGEEVEKWFFDNVRPSSLLKRFESTDEVAALVAFIASPLSSGTNGAALRVEGGLLRSIL